MHTSLAFLSSHGDLQKQHPSPNILHPHLLNFFIESTSRGSIDPKVRKWWHHPVPSRFFVSSTLVQHSRCNDGNDSANPRPHQSEQRQPASRSVCASTAAPPSSSNWPHPTFILQTNHQWHDLTHEELGILNKTSGISKHPTTNRSFDPFLE